MDKIGNNTQPNYLIFRPTRSHDFRQRLKPVGVCGMDIEGIGFVIGLIGAIWMKSSMNLIRDHKDQPELKMIGREPENPALKAFIRGVSLVLLGLGIETYARLFLN
jgi:hypothetical protein